MNTPSDPARTLAEVKAAFIEKVGLITQAEGLPRIAGRVLGLLVFEGDAIAFGDLAERLQVSRGSISSSVRLLEERGLIKRTARPGERQDFFALAPDPYATMIDGARRRVRAARQDIDATITILPHKNDGTAARLADFAAFYGAIDDGLGMALTALSKDEPDTNALRPGETT